jgi:nucleoside-diphosphate-sugar epimerase
MKIFLIGGTGLVGSYLLPKLVEGSHKVFVLTRDDKKIERIEKLGGYGIQGDIRDLRSFKHELSEKPDVIVLVAMPDIKPGQRITKARKEELRAETNIFFRNSINLAVRFNVPVILPGGISYETENDETADETWPILRSGLTEIGTDTDQMVAEAMVTSYPKVIQLIYGKIYGNGGFFRFMYNMMEKGKSKIIGEGDNFIPNIHAGDAASAIIKTIEKLPTGEKFIIADDTPVTQKDFSGYMATLMNKKQPGHVPDLIFRLAFGKDFYDVSRMNCKVSNAKAKKTLDWRPQYPSYREGLVATISEMRTNKNYFDL